MRPTIKDVAKRVGVSVTTVSMVLNDPNCSISEPTRVSVIRAVQELGYRPNRLAVSLVTKKTNTIGLIFSTDINSFQTAFLNHIGAAASEHGYSIIFGAANDNAERTVHYLNDFSDRGVDGIILTQSSFRDKKDTAVCLKAIADLRVPIVLTDRVPDDCSEDMIKINDFLGGFIAVKHLLDLGHRKIGLVTGPMHITNCVKRLEGCVEAFKNAGVRHYRSRVYEGKFHIDCGINALPYLLNKGVTAIFAFNDLIAYGIYKASRANDINIPDDLSVVGFDDLMFSDVIYPPLTTMEFPLKEMAAATISRLIQRIGGAESDPPCIMIFDPKLKIKSSTRSIG